MLNGAKYEKDFAAITTPALGIPQPDDHAKVTINPIDIDFPRGQMKTAWKTFAMNSITLTGCELNPDQEGRLLARWRIHSSHCNGAPTFRLLLEVLTIPINEDPIKSMTVKVREVVESTSAPVVVGNKTKI